MGRLTLQDTMNMVKIKMRLALDTGSQRVCCRVKSMAPYRLALVGLEGAAVVTGRHSMAQAFVPLSQTPFACFQPAPAPAPIQLLSGKWEDAHGGGVSLCSKGLTWLKERSGLCLWLLGDAL